VQPFRVDEEDYTDSIVLCASNRDDLVVTTAVSASRSEEPELLHSLLDSTKDSPYLPFSEDHHSKVDADQELYEATIDASATCLSVATKSKRGAEQTQTHLHAVNAALLLEELLSEGDEPLVISTIGETHAAELLRALASDDCSVTKSQSPTITHAPKMWWYYPTAMIGGLTSQYLSHFFTTSVIPNIYFNIRVIRDDTAPWSAIDEGRSQSELSYQMRSQESAYGDTEAERMYCWYAGILPTDEPSDRVTPAYPSLENWIRDSDNERFLSLLRMFR